MTMKANPQDAVRLLRGRIAQSGKGLSAELSDQVLTQLLQSMGGPALEPVISNMELGEDALEGQVILFTERLLVVAKVKDAAHERDPIRPRMENWAVSVSLHPRSDLTRIEVLSPDPPPGWGYEWEFLARGTRVLLHYQGFDTPIEVTDQNTKYVVDVLSLARADLAGK